MVSQTPNDEWEAPPSRSGSTLSVDSRQAPPSVRTPPSYFDAVRSRHSLSQPDPYKPDKPLSPQQVKYNSLPRPLPQRLQTVSNGVDGDHKPHGHWSERVEERGNLAENQVYHPPPAETRSGFQVYTKPPGPANHVPLTSKNHQFPDMSSSSSLPRCFPRTSKLTAPTASYTIPKDVQQPLSIVVQPSDLSRRAQSNGLHQSNAHSRHMTLPDHVRQSGPPQRRPPPPMVQQASNGQLTLHRPPYVNTDVRQEPGRSVHPQKSSKASRDTRSHSSAPQNFSSQYPGVPYNQEVPQGGEPAFQPPNNLRLTRTGAFQPQQPRRDYIPEPVVSMRTGPLGSYPEPRPNSLPIHSPPIQRDSSTSRHLLKCVETKNSFHPEYPYHDRQDPLDDGKQRHCQSSEIQPRPYQQPVQSSSHPLVSHTDYYPYPSYPPQGQQTSYKHGYHPPSSVPPRTANTFSENGHIYQKPPLPESRQFMSDNGKYGSVQKSPDSPKNQFFVPEPASGPHGFSFRKPENEYNRFSPKNMRETPVEAGLVMIVESRDLSNQVNSVAKDVVKPTPRLPVSPTIPLSSMSNSPSDNLLYKPSHDRPRSDGESPKYNGTHYDSLVCRTGFISPTSPKAMSTLSTHSLPQWNLSNSDVPRMYQESGIQQVKPMNMLRRTPLSSSTASLSSEISSVSSRQQKKSAVPNCQKRFPGSVKVMHGSSAGGGDKKNEISPSPWTREEKEERQKQQVLGARQARDNEIEFLESLQDRTEKQEEWLRILRLEKEFQKRAEEVGDEDDDEDDDEALLERAEHRERLLLMEKEMATSEPPKREKGNKTEHRSVTSSSDQWLANSQAKQPPKPKCNENLHNASFEVEQFNDFLETMNMSPIIRETQAPGDVGNHVQSQPTGDYAFNNSQGRVDVLQSPSRAIDVSYTAEPRTYQAKPIPAPRTSKTLSPIPPSRTNDDVKTNGNPPIEFCYPVDSVHHAKTDMHASTAITTARSPKEDSIRSLPSLAAQRQENATSAGTGINSSDQVDGQRKGSRGNPDVILSKIDDKNQSKFALRIPLNVGAKENREERSGRESLQRSEPIKEISKNHAWNSFLENSSRSVSEGFRSLDFNRGTIRQTNRNRSKDISPLNGEMNKVNGKPVLDSNAGSPCNEKTAKSCNGFQKELRGGGGSGELKDKSPEYAKMWTSRPEKLTFLDKIRKFSLQAGDDDVPRDKVKNSRAQRELEIKFSSDNGKPIELKTT